MKQRIKRLTIILNLKQDSLQKKSVKYREIQHLWLFEKKKQEQLIAYRSDYLGNLNSKSSVSADLMQTYFKFIAQLDTAIEQQQKQITEVEKRKVIAHNEYMEGKKEVESIEKLIKKQQTELDLHLELQHQKEIDEYAQKQWYSNRNNHE
jgi:flagellar FliJ protein